MVKYYIGWFYGDALHGGCLGDDFMVLGELIMAFLNNDRGSSPYQNYRE